MGTWTDTMVSSDPAGHKSFSHRHDDTFPTDYWNLCRQDLTGRRGLRTAGNQDIDADRV